MVIDASSFIQIMERTPTLDRTSWLRSLDVMRWPTCSSWRRWMQLAQSLRRTLATCPVSRQFRRWLTTFCCRRLHHRQRLFRRALRSAPPPRAIGTGATERRAVCWAPLVLKRLARSFDRIRAGRWNRRRSSGRRRRSSARPVRSSGRRRSQQGKVRGTSSLLQHEARPATCPAVPRRPDHLPSQRFRRHRYI